MKILIHPSNPFYKTHTHEQHTPLNISLGGIQHHDDDVCCPGNSNDLPTSTLTFKGSKSLCITITMKTISFSSLLGSTLKTERILHHLPHPHIYSAVSHHILKCFRYKTIIIKQRYYRQISRPAHFTYLGQHPQWFLEDLATGCWPLCTEEQQITV